MTKTYSYILIIGSLVGLFASFFLTLDTIKLIENPAAEIPCNINPFISCASAATAWQGEVFGFPNSILGLVSFSMLFAIGVMLFSGGRSRRPLWLLVNLGTLASVIFVIWFLYQSLYNLGTLCIYCMIVWAVTWPIFLYTTIWNYKENHFPLSSFGHSVLNFVAKHHLQVLLAWYVVILGLIFIEFKDFFLYQ